MRTIKELLQILREEILNDTYRWKASSFMCVLANTLHLKRIITGQEYQKLSNYLASNKPEETRLDGGWFPPGEKKPRLLWLDYHIDNKKEVKFTKKAVIDLLEKEKNTTFQHNREYEKRKVEEAISIIHVLIPPNKFPDKD